MLQSVKNARYKKRKKKPLLNRKAAWKNRMQVRAVHNARYVLRQCGIEFFLKLLKSNFSSLSHMNWTGHIKWLRSSCSKKEDAPPGVCQVPQLSLFSVHTTFWVLPSVVLYLAHINYLLLLHESNGRHNYGCWTGRRVECRWEDGPGARGQRQRWPPVPVIINVLDGGSQRDCVRFKRGEHCEEPESWLMFCCCSCSLTKSCLTLCNPMDCSMPGSSVLQYLLACMQA